jgi:Ca2+-binding RTX toxin-like protein
MAKPIRNQPYVGTDGDDVYGGTAGNDTISGLAGNDMLSGGDGADSIYGGLGDDFISGGAGNDPVLFGHEGNDTILGGDGDDYLAGQEGNDILDGGAGNDFVGAGPGNDTLTGGLGADRFFFTANIEAGTQLHTITDFSRTQGDFIDLRSIDADGDSSNNTRRGNTDFTIVDGPSTVAGTAWLVTGPDGVSIFLNTDGDPEADAQILVAGAPSLTWGIDILG